MANNFENIDKIETGTVFRKLAIGRGISKTELAGLYQIALELGMARQADRVLRLIVRRARRLLKADASYIVLYDEASGQLYVGPHTGLRTGEFKEIRVRPGEAASGWIFKERKMYLTDNYFTDPRFPHTIDSLVAGEGIVSGIGVPLVFKDESLGVLYVVNRKDTRFTPEQAELLGLFANQASIALGMARVYDEMERRNQQLLTINQLGNHVLGVLDLEPTLLAVARWCALLFKGSAAAVWLQEGTTLVRRGAFGGGKRGGRSKIPFNQVNHLFRSDGAVQHHELDNHTYRLFPPRYNSVVALCLTLSRRNIRGIIAISYPQRRQLSDNDNFFFQTVGKYALMAIENALSYTSVDHQLTRRARELTILHEMSRTLFTINDSPEELFTLVSDRVMEVFDVRATALAANPGEGEKTPLWLVKKEGKDQIAKVKNGLSRPLEWNKPPDPFWIDDSNSIWDAPLSSLDTNGCPDRALAVPLAIGTELLGVFIVAFKNSQQSWDLQQYDFLYQMLGLVTLSLKNSQLKIKARELAVLAERNRIATQLHDTVIQILFSTGLSLDRLLMDEKERGAPAEEIVRHSKTLIQKGISEIRQVIFELAGPKNEQSLAELLESLLLQARLEGVLATRLKIVGEVEMLPLAAKLLIIRTARELVTNVVKHAGAGELSLRLSLISGWINLRVADNGGGRAEEIKKTMGHGRFHFGLSMLRESLSRVRGRLVIGDNSPRGVVTRVRIPVAAFKDGN